MDHYKAKWFAYLKERWGLQRPTITPANNPDPNCRKCWDKGYASAYVTTSGYADFAGDKGYTRTELKKIFCQNCYLGRRLEVEDAYQRGMKEGHKNPLDIA